MRQKYKKSKDYPQITIRLQRAGDRSEIDALVEDAMKKQNTGIKEGEKRFREGPVMVAALKFGLKHFKKKTIGDEG